MVAMSDTNNNYNNNNNNNEIAAVSQRMEAAYDRDVADTFTLYEPPQLLQREPVHYNDFFDYLYAHLQYRQGMQIAAAQNLCYAEEECKRSAKSLLVRAGYVKEVECEMDYIPDILQRLLPIAVGDVIPLSKEVKDIEFVLRPANDIINNNNKNNNNNNINKFEKNCLNVSDKEERRRKLLELHTILTAAKEAAAGIDEHDNNSYSNNLENLLFAERKEYTSTIDIEKEEARREVLHYLFAENDEMTVCQSTQDVMFGLRQISDSSTEYITRLYEYALSEYDAAHNASEQMTERYVNTKEMKDKLLTYLPSFLRPLLANAEVEITVHVNTPNSNDHVNNKNISLNNLASTHPSTREILKQRNAKGADSCLRNDYEDNATTEAALRRPVNKNHLHDVSSNNNSTNDDEDGGSWSENEAAALNCVQSDTNEVYVTGYNLPCYSVEVIRYNTAPAVITQDEAVLDSLLPPRLLEFFDIDYFTMHHAVHDVWQHEASLLSLWHEYTTHKDNKHLLHEIQREIAYLTHTNPIVGQCVLLAERVSQQWPSREQMATLERNVIVALEHAQARCVGNSLLSKNASEEAALLQSELQTEHAAVSLTPTTIIPGLASDDNSTTHAASQNDKLKSKSDVDSNQVVIKKKTTNLCSTTRGHNNHNNNHNYHCFFTTTNVITNPKKTAQAPSKSSGGTVTVIPTLNVIELNHERRVIHFNLLKEELLRQVILDLPERGVLLSRIFKEAEYSMNMYDVLLREANQVGSEGLLEGQEERAHDAAQVNSLESEVARLKAQKRELSEKRKALIDWSVQCATNDAQRTSDFKEYTEQLIERIKKFTSDTYAEMEMERRS